MTVKVVLDGVVVDPEEARVSVFDRGFLYGDSVYEVLRTYSGRPFALDLHLERLARSAASIAMDLPVGLGVLAQEIALGLESAANPESYIRVVVTRGAGEIGLDPALAENPRRVVIVRPLVSPDPALYAGGASVALVGPTRTAAEGAGARGNPKTGNYLPNIMALRHAKQKGAYEALLVDSSGHVIEGSSSNVFVVEHGVVRTPPVSGILEGITRRHVLEVARAAGIPTVEVDLPRSAITGADEVFITSTIREIVPVTRVDGQPVGGGRPGPVTGRIALGFRELTTRRA